MQLNHSTYRPDIDGLRAIAIISAVGFHAFPNLLPGGFIGVDIFFVISGYLISTILFSSLERGSFSFTEFYIRRIKRIFPALILVLTSCFLFGWLFLLADEFRELAKQIAGAAGFVSNFIFWFEAGYFDVASEAKPLLHLWSLAIEEQFYVVWPFLLWLAWTLRANLFAVTLILGAASFTLNLTEVTTNSVATFYSPQTRFWELLCGGALAWITLHSPARKLNSLSGNRKLGTIFNKYIKNSIYVFKNIQSTVGIFVIFYSIFNINKGMPFPGVLALLPIIGSVLIISANKTSWANQFFLSHRAMVWVGLISYPLYLWHWPLLAFARIEENGTPSTNLRIALVAISILLAWLTYKFVEKPFRNKGSDKSKAIVLVTLMIITGYVGYKTYSQSGFQTHYPALRYKDMNSQEIKRLFSPINFRWNEYIRFNECHLQARGDLFIDKRFSDSCRENKRPLIALWGDSNASALYPGLKKLQEDSNNKFGIIQLTAGGCPPVLNSNEFVDTKNCSEINNAALDILEKDQPDLLILNSVYLKPGFSWTAEIMLARFSNTLDLLSSRLPKTRILLIGPAPQWATSPQMTTYFYWKNSADKSKPVPILQKANLLTSVDLSLRALAKLKNVQYVSAIDVLCDDSKCLSRVGDEPTDFIATDATHFSKSGSEYFIRSIQSKILSELPTFN